MTFVKWTALFLLLSWTLISAWAQAPPVQAPSLPEAAKAAGPEPSDAFAQARLLLQRGQYDPAIDRLNQLQAQKPGLNLFE